MAQIAKIVDLNKSYLPIDPQAFAQNLSYTAQEDTPEKGLPIVCFEGYNFLPTSYGYRSYFGTETELTLDALPKLCDKIFMIQSKTYENMIVALCSDGIYTASVGSNAWTKILSLTDTWTASGVYSQHTFCIIENILYIYRQGHSHVLRIKDDLTNDTFIPSFLNMTGQMGIFRANGRLAFWDSEDSVAWSSAFDLTDFTPSIENLVGNSTFFGVLGRIVTIVPHGEGFIIYSTKSVVGVSYSNSATNIWDAMVITSISGISHPKAVCIGSTVKEHFIYTTNGIAKVGHFNALSRQYEVEYILPELYDFLKESRDPVAVECHAARFLHFCVIDPAYINGRTSFTTTAVNELKAPDIVVDSSLWPILEAEGDIGKNTGYQVLYNMFRNPYNVCVTDETADIFDQPLWSCVYDLPPIVSVAKSSGYFQDIALIGSSTSTSGDIIPLVEQITSGYAVPNVGTNYTYDHNSTANPEIYSPGTDKSKWPLMDLHNSIIRTITRQLNSHKRGVTKELKTIADNIWAEDHISGQNCMEFLYNWMETIDELNTNYIEQYKNALAAELALNKTRIISIDSLFTAPIYTLTSPTIKAYIPKKGGSITTHTMNNEDYHYNPDLGLSFNQVSINVSYNWNQAYRISLASTRVVDSEFTTNIIDSYPAGTTHTVKLYNAETNSTSTILTFTHEPSMQELINYFTANPWFISGGFYNRAYKLNPDQINLSLSAPDSTISGNYVITKVPMETVSDLTTGVHFFYADLYISVNISEVSDTTQLLEAVPILGNEAAYDDMSATYNTIGIWPTTTAKYFNNKDAALDAVYQYLKYVSNLGIGITTYSGDVIWIDKDSLFIDGVEGPSPDYDPDQYAIYASGRYGDLSTFTDEAIVWFSPAKKHTAILIETPTYTIEEVTAPDIDSTLAPLTAKFINRRISRHTKIVGGYSLNNTMQVPYSLPLYHSSYNIPAPSVVDPYPSRSVYMTTVLVSTIGFSTDLCYKNFIYDIDAVGSSGIYSADFMDHTNGKLLSVDMPLGPVANLYEAVSCNLSGYELPGNEDGFFTGTLSNFTYPGATYQLQDGVPIPGYPSYSGSIVFDIHLKKWGKQKNTFKALMEFAPLNSTDNAVIPYTNFGMDSGILKESLKLSLFSQVPAQSMMRYGKFGLYRLGFTEALEFVLHFRTNSTGSITVDGSVDGRDLDLGIQHTETFTNVRSHIVKCHVNAMWQTLTISGQFDLQFMEFRGIIAARR